MVSGCISQCSAWHAYDVSVQSLGVKSSDVIVGQMFHYSGCMRTPACCAGPVALELYEALTSIQQQRADDPFDWVVEVV